jgi:glycosyltransferase involved in cell wall biosynthesis
MRVLYLNPFSQEVSGPDESLRTLLAALSPRGVEAHVALPAPGPQVDRYRALGATVHFVPLAPLRRDLSLGTAVYPARFLRSVALVRGLARRIGAELIHTNMEVLLEGGLVARSLAIPHVLHYRGNTLDRPARVFDALTAIWVGTADHIFCISRATAGIFERRQRAQKVEVLYNPIDVDRFGRAARSDDVRASLGAPPTDRLIGTVGRIHPRKDLETFLRAATKISADRPDLRFVVVGAAEVEVEKRYEQKMRALARELGLDGRLTFAGARRDIPAVMAALDVFVLTSRHEGFGRVVAEAMAAARPIVVADEGAPPELVEAGRFGVSARPGDPGDFALQIGRLLADAESTAALGARAAAHARDFDAARVAERVHACYRRLLDGRRGGRGPQA